MVTDREAQFVAPDRQRPVADQRPVRATVGVRYRCSCPVIALIRQLVKLDRDALGGPAEMSVEDVGAETTVHERHALARHLGRDAKPRDVKDLLYGGRELLPFVVQQTALELLQDRVSRVAAHTDDKGKAELFLVGIVQAMEARELLLGQRVETDARLLVA